MSSYIDSDEFMNIVPIEVFQELSEIPLEKAEPLETPQNPLEPSETSLNHVQSSQTPKKNPHPPR